MLNFWWLRTNDIFVTSTFLATFDDAGSGVVSTNASNGGVLPTFTRATTATTVLSNGLIGGVASGAPRSFYDPTSLTYLGYLAEGARTNLLLRSEDMTNASWTKTDTTPTLAGTGPDGVTNSANLLTEGSAGTAVVLQTVTATADVSYATTRFMKRGNTDWVFMDVAEAAAVGNGVRVWFNLALGTVGTVTNAGSATGGVGRIKAYPNSWYRCEVAGTVGNGATGISSRTFSASADASTTRVANSTRLEFGTGFENNVSFASSYIPTTTATVTRNADVLTYPTTGWYSATTGTMFAQGTFLSGSVALTQTEFGVYTDTSNYISIEKFNANASGNIVTASVTQAAVASTATTVGVSIKGALAYAANDATASFNGGTVGTDVSVTLPTVTTAGVGHTAGINHMFGTISRVAYWSYRFPNEQLQQVTQ